MPCGGIGLFYTTESTIRFGTVAANSATAGGGIYANGAAAVGSSILAGNSAPGAGPDCNDEGQYAGYLTSRGYNLLQDAGAPVDRVCFGGFFQPTDLGDQDPLLGALGDNGGATWTQALLPGSPAIDAGDDTFCPTTDQRGVPRPQGDHCDMGAYEAPSNQPPELVPDSGSVAADEGQIATNSGSVSDPDGDPVTLSTSVGTASVKGDGRWSWSFSTTDGPAESQTVKITADDGNGGLTEAMFALTVTNVPPTVSTITAPTQPLQFGTPVGVDADFMDPAETVDRPYGCTVNYGDESGDLPGEVSGMTCEGPDHDYANSGVYVVSVTFVDKNSGSGNAQASEYVVVYDPDGGFVTGGGWIWANAGYCQLDETCEGAEGKANFGFASRYKKSAAIPTGNTEFVFQAADFNFHSTSYDWLVVTGSDYARFKGSGNIVVHTK